MTVVAVSKQHKSHLSGPAREPNGRRTTAYEARIDVPCAQCGVLIAPDHLFSRHALRGHPEAVVQMTLLPVCTACRPLQIEARETTGGDPHGDL